MKETYTSAFIDFVSKQYGGFKPSYIKTFVKAFPSTSDLTLCNVKQVLLDYKKKFEAYFYRASYSQFREEIITINSARQHIGNSADKSLCDTLERFFIDQMKAELNSAYLYRNLTDGAFILGLYLKCDPEGEHGKVNFSWWNEANCNNKIAALIPHIETPFILTLLRYSWYNYDYNLIESDITYRRNIRLLGDVDFSKIDKVNFGAEDKKQVCEHYLLTCDAGLGDIDHPIVQQYSTLKKEEVHSYWYLTLIEKESVRLKRDQDLLRKICTRSFAADLMRWHNFYFKYLIECLHGCKDYKDYPIEKLVPQLKTAKPKQKSIDETLALTPLGMCCRKAIIAKIRECRTAADFGALLYKFQYDLKFFTKGVLSKNECYLCMQQMGKVHFDSSGDFSNCNKGYNLANKKASKK